VCVTLLPFDPEKVLGPAAEGTDRPRRDGARPLTVTQVAELIKRTLQEQVPSPLKVIGQVSNLSRSNHWFFSLKDEHAVIGCVVWASTARALGFVPADGDEVVATGHVSHYAPQGRTQLYVNKLEPVGAGALELKFRALCDELRRLGYFDEKRKKPLPAFPRRIAVITSLASAAVTDVIGTAAQRLASVGLLLVDVRVQGEGAAEQVAAAIRRVDRQRRRLGVDAILVTRGGGSAEDLWAFNDRAVADAVFDCSLPLVAAIGHESDTTVIELVADLRAATPTQAVMHLIPAGARLREQIDHLNERLTFLLRRALERGRQRLETLARHPLLRDPAMLLRQPRQDVLARQRDLVRAVRRRIDLGGVLAAHGVRLGRAMQSSLQRLCERADALQRQLGGVDPNRVLARGYSYTTTLTGRLVKSVGDVAEGQLIRTRLSDGAIESQVQRVTSRRGREAGAAPGEHMDLVEGSQ